MSDYINLFIFAYKICLVGQKTALEEVAEAETDDVNRIDDAATPEENKKFDEH